MIRVQKKLLFFLVLTGLGLLVYRAFLQLPPLSGSWPDLFKGRGSFAPLLKEKKAPVSLKVPILIYHYVEDVTDERDYLRRWTATRPAFFEAQLKFLKENGYTAIRLSDLGKALAGQAVLPAKPVILTFDDGYRDYYTTAFPLLKKYGFASINYIIVNHIGRSGNLTEPQIAEMLQSGWVEIGCHTLDHVYLDRITIIEAERQIGECQEQLERRFGVKVPHFAYPGGYFNQAVAQLVAEAGFETAVSAQAGVTHDLEGLYQLRRLRVGNLDPSVFGQRLQGPKAE